MNNWICPKCNAANSYRFCLNCGEETNTEAQSASDLPPTVFGMPSPPISDPPKKPRFLKAVLTVGLVGLIALIPISAAGFLLYIKVIDPYLAQQRWEKQEQNNLSNANSKTAKELLPESITSKSQIVGRGQVIDKFQLLEMTKVKMPEVNSDIKDINDAISARYASADKKEAGLAIFKYNSPEQAQNACQKIGREMIKNKDNFVKDPRFDSDDRRGFCGISGLTKNGEYVAVNSIYGFLYISSGYTDYAQELSSQVWRKLI